MSFDLLEIDLGSDDARQLFASIRHRAGSDLAAIPALLDRIFQLRSEWAPGLCFVGAEARVRDGTGKWPPFSFGGCALTLEDALLSCLGEAAERLSQVERATDVRFTAPLPGLDGVSREVAELGSQVLVFSGRSEAETCDWVEAVDLKGRPARVPADWCIRRASAGPLKIPGAALSVGCAAGATREDARRRALLELAERDAVSLWWDGGRPARPLASDELPTTAASLRQLRGAARARDTAFLDLTTDLAIPVVAAYSTDPHGSGFVCGFAARESVDAAAVAALVELCQMEVGLQVALVKRQELGEQSLHEGDRKHLVRAARVDTYADPHFARFLEDARALALEHQKMSIEDKFDRLATAFLVDLARADIGVPVIKAIAPTLQLAPCELKGERLQSEAAMRGAGAPAADLF
jgi:ribosomal protein S12 methylthiotransferase accessory factor